MKIRFYKMEACMYFSILLYISKKLKELPELEKDINLLSEGYVKQKFLMLIPKKISEDYVFKMINCVGNVIFEKKDKFYFARPDDSLPVLLYFNTILENVMELQFDEWKKIIMSNLSYYEHTDFRNNFFIFKNRQVFKTYLQKNFDNYELYLSRFYRKKKRYLCIRKKTIQGGSK